jgi:hypothetical protein
MDVFYRFKVVVVLFVSRDLRADQMVFLPEASFRDFDDKRVFDHVYKDRKFSKPFVGSLPLQRTGSGLVLKTPFDPVQRLLTLLVSQLVLNKRDAIILQRAYDFFKVGHVQGLVWKMSDLKN